MKTLLRTKRKKTGSRLRRTVVFLDCGDTLADEGTEIKNKNEVTLRARMIPGAARTVRKLKRKGYTLALVADGPRGTFENILKPRGLFELFDAHAISREVGVEKPDGRMFLAALNALNIPPEQFKNVVMVGNNLFRDIKGANDLGLVTVWLDWAPRRSKTPADPSEVPDFTIKKPFELIRIIERLEKAAETAAERTDG
ncbi:MAG: HAD family hydrolase [Spirochaetaceae bacterium]|nr:MAG: HAD family hydrolase [Spirochaetaceae bacterium]